MPRPSRSRSHGRPRQRTRSPSRSPSRERSRSRGRRPAARSNGRSLSDRGRRGSRSAERGRNSRRRRSVSSSRSHSRSRSSSASSRSASRSPPRRGRRGDRDTQRRRRSRSTSSSASGSSVSSDESRSQSRTPERKQRRDANVKRERSGSQASEPKVKRRHVEEAENSVKQERMEEEDRPVQRATADTPPPQAPKEAERTLPRERKSKDKSPPRPVKEEQISDRTPPRRSDKHATPERTPPRRTERGETPERTPPRRSKRDDTPNRTPPRRSQAEGNSDGTPPRRSKRDATPERTPPRRSKRDSTPERTPPRRSKKDRKRRSSTPESRSKRSSTPERRSKSHDRRRSSSPAPPAAVREAPKPNILLDNTVKGRTGGVYIPPFKLAQMRKEEKNPSSETYQRQSWEALRKSINGLINKVNVSNISNIIPELFQENLVRGRGLLARSIMKAQLASPGFTHIYAALLAVINTKLPECGELVIKRVVYRFRRAFKRGDKVVAIALVRFIAHLVNQQIVHELLALEVLTLLLANPTDDSVEVAVNFTKECGQILAELCPEGLRAIFERFRGILHEGEIDMRVQYTIEGLFAIRKGGFADYPAVHEQLDLVESGDQITHEITLEEDINREDQLDIFRFDPEFEKNESMWSAIKKEILGESDSDSESGSGSSGSESDDEEEEEEAQQQVNNSASIQDMTEQDLVNLRRTIYLTIMSSISHEECAHKLLKLNIRPGQEKEICNMLLECCSQERTYLRYFGLLGQRFCMIKREYQDAFDECFAEQYALIHRLETNKLRNVAKFFAHLLFTDALPWTVFEFIRLNEEDTTSSSRIFIKILCQELSEHMGMKKLKERFLDPIMEQTFSGLFPKDNPRNTRFAINFFTSIGLGGLTTELREYLKNAPTMIMAQAQQAPSSDSDSGSDSDTDSDSSSGSSSGSSGSSSGSDSSSDSSSSDSDSD